MAGEYRSSPLEIPIGLNFDPLGRQWVDVKRITQHELKNLSNMEAAVNIKFKFDMLNAKGDQDKITAATRKWNQELQKISAARLAELEQKALAVANLDLPNALSHGKNVKAYWKEQLNYAQLQQALDALPKEKFDLFAGLKNRRESGNIQKEISKLQNSVKEFQSNIDGYVKQQVENAARALSQWQKEFAAKSPTYSAVQKYRQLLDTYNNERASAKLKVEELAGKKVEKQNLLKVQQESLNKVLSSFDSATKAKNDARADLLGKYDPKIQSIQSQIAKARDEKRDAIAAQREALRTAKDSTKAEIDFLKSGLTSGKGKGSKTDTIAKVMSDYEKAVQKVLDEQYKTMIDANLKAIKAAEQQFKRGKMDSAQYNNFVKSTNADIQWAEANLAKEKQSGRVRIICRP